MSRRSSCPLFFNTAVLLLALRLARSLSDLQRSKFVRLEGRQLVFPPTRFVFIQSSRKEVRCAALCLQSQASSTIPSSFTHQSLSNVVLGTVLFCVNRTCLLMSAGYDLGLPWKSSNYWTGHTDAELLGHNS